MTETQPKPTLYCAECGEEMIILEDSETSHHLTEDGDIDYDQDADHVAIDDREYGQGF